MWTYIGRDEQTRRARLTSAHLRTVVFFFLWTPEGADVGWAVAESIL